MPTGLGRVVRWDTRHATGALVVEGVEAEVWVDGVAVQAHGRHDLQPGELVEVDYRPDDGGRRYRAVRVVPVDG